MAVKENFPKKKQIIIFIMFDNNQIPQYFRGHY
jgi:hypothetical protein